MPSLQGHQYPFNYFVNMFIIIAYTPKLHHGQYIIQVPDLAVSMTIVKFVYSTYDSRCLRSKRSNGQMLATGVLLAAGALLAVQVMKVVAWVKYGDWLMIVLYISVAEKTAPGVSMGGAESVEVVGTLLLLSS